jgi:BMFP domain-containing protein YqiC
MTSTQSRFFDELAKLMSNAAGAAQGLRREIDTLVQAQVERVVNNLELVRRDDFEVAKAMAAKALDENDALSRRVAQLEARLSAGSANDSPSDSRAD